MKIPRGITKLVRVATLGDTPAKTNRMTGVVWVNKSWFERLPEDVQFFILCHEAGHINCQTTDELLADEWGFNYYIKNGGKSLQNAVYALTRVLDFSNPEHNLRMEQMLKNALQYDYKVNKNEAALQQLQQLFPTNFNSPITPKSMFVLNRDEQLESRFLGIAITKKQKEQKAIRQDLRNDKKAAKVSIKEAKAFKKSSAGEAKTIRATAKLVKSESLMPSTSTTPPDQALEQQIIAQEAPVREVGTAYSPEEVAAMREAQNIAATETEEATIAGMPAKYVYIAAAVLVVVIVAVVYFMRKK